jgi:hypothetical protein
MGEVTDGIMANEAEDARRIAGLQEQVLALREETLELSELRLAMGLIHQDRTMLDGYGMPVRYCVEDRQKWPCETARAVHDVRIRHHPDEAPTAGEEPF